MKKIRLSDQTELEVFNITENGNQISVDILNADSNQMEELFSAKENLAIIQYFVETELMKGFAGYTNLQGYTKRMKQTIDTDYGLPDPATESGFHETKADIVTVILEKFTPIAGVLSQTVQNTANIDYIAMETGVTL